MNSICSVDGCETAPRGPGTPYCPKHYQRMWKHGSTEDRTPPDSTQCSVDGCDGKPRSRFAEYCDMHYCRKWRTGSTTRTHNLGLGWVESNGYRGIPSKGHVLGHAGRVREHRIVLYDKIGPGEHPCHHCGTLVSWDKQYPEDPQGLVTDHLDCDKLNNDPANLVPSCALCNLQRGREKMTISQRRNYADITFRGETLCKSEWAERLGITMQSIGFRLSNGWSLEKALTTPRGVTGPKRKVA
jgi:hypothetical protein